MIGTLIEDASLKALIAAHALKINDGSIHLPENGLPLKFFVGPQKLNKLVCVPNLINNVLFMLLAKHINTSDLSFRALLPFSLTSRKQLMAMSTLLKGCRWVLKQ